MSEEPQQARELAPHYYRDNFQRLLDTVEVQYGDLLNSDENRFLSDYRDLGFDAQCLYVRLVSRVGPWFREAKLHYPELDNVSAAVDELLQAGLALQTESLPLLELSRLLTRQELAQGFGLPASASKAELLVALDDGEDKLLAPLLEGRVIAPLATDTVALMSLLFFGNRRQGLTDFVLDDLGVARYYPYSLDRTQRLFPNRAALDEYLACAALSDAWYEAMEAELDPGLLEALAVSIRDFSPCHGTSQRRWHRLCNTVARELERMDQGVLAMSLYQPSGLHPARERCARLLEKAGREEDALALCEVILSEPWGEEERDAAARIRPRLLRKLQGVRATRKRDNFDTVSLALARGEHSVEHSVAESLVGEWQQVHYVENRLMNALFGLVFWEQMFASLPGAFHNPYQAAPSDMFEQGFAQRREELLEVRLSELAVADLSQLVPAAWRKYRGYQSRWVNWRAVDEDLVKSASAIIPAEHLLAIWRRMLFDPGENRRGFPDLLALGQLAGEYRMIEVKGPGDALQESQKRWLRFFDAEGIPASVAWVSWLDD